MKELLRLFLLGGKRPEVYDEAWISTFSVLETGF